MWGEVWEQVGSQLHAATWTVYFWRLARICCIYEKNRTRKESVRVRWQRELIEWTREIECDQCSEWKPLTQTRIELEALIWLRICSQADDKHYYLHGHSSSVCWATVALPGECHCPAVCGRDDVDCDWRRHFFVLNFGRSLKETKYKISSGYKFIWQTLNYALLVFIGRSEWLPTTRPTSWKRRLQSLTTKLWNSLTVDKDYLIEGPAPN